MTGIYSLLEGKTLSGRYQVERLISRGGMGAVFRGTDVNLGRRVAIKVIALEPESPEQAASLRARFRREAHAAARLRHPHVVTLYDFETDETMGLDFIVMELLEGEDIQSRVRRTGPLPWRQVSRILYEAAQGLGAGHHAGLVHRDVKSANLFLECDAEGKPLRTRVLDFGIAQLKADAGATATHLTVMGHAPLSPPYASPEQQRGERELTPAADVWGLGVTAFEMLTGTLPYNESQRAALAAGSRVQVPSVLLLNPAVPPEAESLIRRALSARPGDRPQDGDAFAREVSAIRRGMRAAPAHRAEPMPAAPVMEARAEPRPVPPAQPAVLVGDAPERRGRGWVSSALALVVSMMIFGALASAVFSDRGPGNKAVEQDFAPASINPPRAATESEIQYIRQVFQTIESRTSPAGGVRISPGGFAAREWPSADSVSAQVYGDPHALGKIRVRVFTDQIRTSLLFYYDAGNLVFVHELRGFAGSNANAEQRFYFLDRALIRWRDQDNQIVPLGAGYSGMARTLLGISDNLLQSAPRP